MLRASVLAAGLSLALVSTLAAQTQTLPRGFLNVEGSSSTGFPFNTANASHTWQWVYDSAQFDVCDRPIQINEIYVRSNLNAAIPNAFNFPSLEVTLSESPNDYQLASQNATFALNLGAGAAVVRPASPWTGGPVPAGVGTGTFIPLGITPYVYDPSSGQDFLVQLRLCGASPAWGTALDGQTGAAGVVRGNRYGNTTAATGCTALTRNFNNNEFVPIIRIDYTPIGASAEWESNSAAASMDFDSAVGPLCGPFILPRCVGSMVTANFNSSNIGQPWDLAYTLGAPIIPASMGGIVTAGGQIVNLNIASPTLGFLNGLTFAIPFGGFTLPFVLPPLGELDVQSIIIDPANPDGFSLSAAVCLQAVTPAASTIPGPALDDSAVVVTAGLAPTPPSCLSFPTIALYGAPYTQYSISSNGRVTMGPAANTSFGAAAVYGAAEPAFAGSLMDLNPAAGGNITIGVSGGALVVNYNAVSYFAQAGTSLTMSMSIDGSSNVVMSGMNYTAPTAARPAFIGVHPGGTATIEAGYPVTYVGSGSFVSSVAGNSHGLFGDLFTALLTDAGENLIFLYNGAGGYNVSF